MPAWRKYTLEVLTEAVESSTSVAGVLRYLGLAQAGGTHVHISRTIKAMGLDTSHFRRGSGGRRVRRSAEAVLVVRPRGSGREKPGVLRRALLEIGRVEVCDQCGHAGEWQGRPLRLHIDHIDGDFHNNQPDNLRYLCPNCHSQTDTYSGRSRGKYTGSYTRVDQSVGLGLALD